MTTKQKRKTEFESIVMLLQGGGALGAYQAGIYEALHEAGLAPDWVAGISIGSFNAAIIAGNKPEDRLPRLREFWEYITTDTLQYMPSGFKTMISGNQDEHKAIDQAAAMRALTIGVHGFYAPRAISPFMAKPHTLAATSFYDTKPLRKTLQSLIDFKLINNGKIKLNLGATNVNTGDFETFRNGDVEITVDHVMASGALPPGLPAIKIGKDYYWDGGLVSNTPLQWLVEGDITEDTLLFQIDLWNVEGGFPRDMQDVFIRQKDIQYSSRTSSNTDSFTQQHQLRHKIASLLEKLPPKLRDLPEAKALMEDADTNVFNIVHLIYRTKNYEGYSKDCEFSRITMEEHWEAGYKATVETLSHPEVLKKPRNKEGIAIYDFGKRQANKPH